MQPIWNAFVHFTVRMLVVKWEFVTITKSWDRQRKITTNTPGQTASSLRKPTAVPPRRQRELVNLTVLEGRYMGKGHLVLQRPTALLDCSTDIALHWWVKMIPCKKICLCSSILSVFLHLLSFLRNLPQAHFLCLQCLSPEIKNGIDAGNSLNSAWIWRGEKWKLASHQF